MGSPSGRLDISKMVTTQKMGTEKNVVRRGRKLGFLRRRFNIGKGKIGTSKCVPTFAKKERAIKKRKKCGGGQKKWGE